MTIWLNKTISWFAAASGKRERSTQFSYAAIQFCLTIKNLFGLALRQTTGFIQPLLALSGLLWPVPDFSTLGRRQCSLDVQVAYQPSAAGLHLLVDSAGIKFLGEGEWKCKKHGAERRRQWRKLHIGIDVQTLQVRAICITSNNVSDAAIVPQLLAQLSPDEPLQTVTGDGAYDTQSVYAAVLEHGATPITPRERMPECAKAMPLRTAMRLSQHAGALVADYRKAGSAITDAAWWKPRCIASNDWESG